MNTPFLSVVIPTYNRKDSLRVTLDGLARQTYPCGSFEAVVVSDGSTDGTETLLAEYAQISPYILRPVMQPNGGPARARNRGIQEAQGEVIVFLDDDVEPTPEFLAVHAAHHQNQSLENQSPENLSPENQSQKVVIGPMLPDPHLHWQEPPWIAWEHAMLEKQYTAWRTGEWAGCGPHHFYSGNASLRRDHLLVVGGFDEQFPRQEDVELAFRLQNQCGVHFVFDSAAHGIHRPQRRFASWLAVPYAYGQLDVVRARRGDILWRDVRHGYHGRNRLTRQLASFVLDKPGLSAPLRAVLLQAAHSAYRLRRSGSAFAALSVLYNIRYLEGVQSEIGGRTEMHQLVLGPELPALSPRGAKIEHVS